MTDAEATCIGISLLRILFEYQHLSEHKGGRSQRFKLCLIWTHVIHAWEKLRGTESSAHSRETPITINRDNHICWKENLSFRTNLDLRDRKMSPANSWWELYSLKFAPCWPGITEFGKAEPGSPGGSREENCFETKKKKKGRWLYFRLLN